MEAKMEANMEANIGQNRPKMEAKMEAKIGQKSPKIDQKRHAENDADFGVDFVPILYGFSLHGVLAGGGGGTSPPGLAGSWPLFSTTPRHRPVSADCLRRATADTF